MMNSQSQNGERNGQMYARTTHERHMGERDIRERDIRWHMIGLISLGVGIGALLGASIALLTAPHSGAHTRLALARELRRRRPSAKTNVFDELGDGISKRFNRQARRLKGMEI